MNTPDQKSNLYFKGHYEVIRHEPKIVLTGTAEPEDVSTPILFPIIVVT